MISEAERQAALDRFRLLRAHLEDRVPLWSVAQAAGIPYRTAARWVSLYHHSGLAGLTRAHRSDRGKRRGLSPMVRELIEGLALRRPRLPMANICRQAGEWARGQGLPPPGYIWFMT